MARAWRGGVLLVIGLLAPAEAVSAQRADPGQATRWNLAEVLRRARAGRAEAQAARWRARAAAERPAQEAALGDPMLMLALDHLPFALDGVDASAVVEQRFPLSRERRFRGLIAGREAERAEAEAGRIVLELELRAAQAFALLQRERRLVRVQQQRVQLAAQLLVAARARYASGSLAGGQAELLRAELASERADLALALASAQVPIAETRLNVALGRAEATSVPELDAASETGPSPTAPLPALVARALRQRPELRAWRAERGRAGDGIALARTAGAPMAFVRGGPSYTMSDGPGVMLMLGLSLPLQRAGRRAALGEAEAREREARCELAAAERAVAGEVALAHARVGATAVELQRLRERLLPLARRSVSASLAGYAAGRLTLAEALEALVGVTDLELELVQVETRLALERARLARAVGAW